MAAESEMLEGSVRGGAAFQAARSAALGALNALGRCHPPVLGDLHQVPHLTDSKLIGR